MQLVHVSSVTRLRWWLRQLERLGDMSEMAWLPQPSQMIRLIGMAVQKWLTQMTQVTAAA